MSDPTPSPTALVPAGDLALDEDFLIEMERFDRTALAGHAQNTAMQADLALYVNRGLAQLGAAEAHLCVLERTTRQDIERLVARWEAVSGPVRARVHRIREALLSLVHAGAVVFPKGKKSLKVAAGTLGVRSKPAHVEVTDEAALHAWAANECPEYSTIFPEVRTRKLSRTALLAYVKETGELPPGCVMHPAQEVPYATPEDVMQEMPHPALPTPPEVEA